MHGDDLVIATHGRGFWIMDDIAPLRALAQNRGRAARGCLRRRPAYRVRPTGFTGSPMPKDEPMGANPPAGAYIDYALDAATSGPVTLTITDARGDVVRTFSSDDPRPPPDLARIDITPDWVVPPSPPATGAGAHRFVWNLHYAPQSALAAEDAEEGESGVWAPPGRYWVELRTGGKLYREPLTVAPDPRVRLVPAAYLHEFALARNIERERVGVGRALAEAGRVHSAIAKQRASAGSGAASAAALSGADHEVLSISDIADEKPTPDSLGRAPAQVGGLRNVAAALKALGAAVDGADAEPSPDAVRGYTRQRALADAALGRWSRFKTDSLPRLNAQLQADGAAPIAP